MPWWPHALLQSWPFCWWVAVVLDHYSRRVVGWEVFPTQPSSEQVIAVLERAIVESGTPPRYIVSDQGTQFRERYRDWCRDRGIRPRFGAVHRYGSIAVTERFMRTLKDEGLRRKLVPLSLRAMRLEVRAFVEWYGRFRPHSALGGATPDEIYFGLPLARDGPRFETRPKWPSDEGVTLRAPQGSVPKLVIHHHRGRRHLPIVELRRAA